MERGGTPAPIEPASPMTVAVADPGRVESPPRAAGRRRPVVWLALLAGLFLLPGALRGTLAFRVLLGEDGVFEWLQVAALATTTALAVAGAARAGRGRRRLLLGVLAVAALFVTGEELAWGTRLLDVSMERVRSRNHQGEVTLHNLGFALEASFLAMAAVSSALALWLATHGRLELACWFSVPACYGMARFLAGAGTYEAAKVSEVAELVFAVAVLRLVRSPTPDTPSRHPGCVEPAALTA